MQHFLKAVCALTFQRRAKKNMLCFYACVLKLYSPVDLCVHTANNFSKFGIEAELLYILIYILVCFTLIFSWSCLVWGIQLHVSVMVYMPINS